MGGGGETKCDTSSSRLLVSDNNDDLNNSMEFISFLARPAMQFDHGECQIARCEDEDQMQSSEEKQEDNFDMFVSALKVKIPSTTEFCGILRQEDRDNGGDGNGGGGGGGGDLDVDDGLKTPTSLDNKITVSLKCPPAPRKPKTLPLKKRKAINGHPRILFDLSSDEIESLFPPVDRDLVSDLGGMIIKKKVRVQAS